MRKLCLFYRTLLQNLRNPKHVRLKLLYLSFPSCRSPKQRSPGCFLIFHVRHQPDFALLSSWPPLTGTLCAATHRDSFCRNSQGLLFFPCPKQGGAGGVDDGVADGAVDEDGDGVADGDGDGDVLQHNTRCKDTTNYTPKKN